MPGTPPMEISDPQDALDKPVEAKPAPSFAKLTHLSDGSPMKNNQSHAEDADLPQREGVAPSEDVVEDRTRRMRQSSREPEYNPWTS